MLEDHQTQSILPTTRRRVDWREAAALLARGLTVGEVAARLDCPAAAIRRNLTRSERFRNWIAAEQAGLARLSRRRLAMLMLKLPDAVEAAMEKGNAAVLKWLADHLVKGELGLSTPLWDPVPPRDEDEADDDLPGQMHIPAAEALAEDDEAGDGKPGKRKSWPRKSWPRAPGRTMAASCRPTGRCPICTASSCTWSTCRAAIPRSARPAGFGQGRRAGGGAMTARPALAETGAARAKAGAAWVRAGSNWRELAALGRGGSMRKFLKLASNQPVT